MKFNIYSIWVILLISVFITSCNNKESSIKNKKTNIEYTSTNNKVVKIEDVNWEQLNPARGDSSPKAGTLWGDRKGEVATGFLVKFVDGFSSPPHIHNVTYRGVVISGLIHNDDPEAEHMWMAPGSFWTQPEGEAHITAAKGKENMAYIEIDSGPYLVHATEKAFDNGERPVNVDATNIIWLDSKVVNNIDGESPNTQLSGVKVSYLWGEPVVNQTNGSLLKLPSGFKGKLISKGDLLKAVVIQGSVEYKLNQQAAPESLSTGSHFSSEDPSQHIIANTSGQETILYIRSNGNYEIIKSN